jgi:hypothetical protein
MSDRDVSDLTILMAVNIKIVVSGMCRHTVWLICNDVSEEPAAFVFRIRLNFYNSYWSLFPVLYLQRIEIFPSNFYVM